jgi:cold shock CspA family protein
MSNRQTGTVKNWNEAKKYGFIRLEKGSDIFFHASAIRGRPPAPGDTVEFVVSKNADNRPRAENVRLI